MNRTLAAGLALLAVALTGYLVGVEASYPGRAFAITGIMVGVALVAVGVAGPSATSRVQTEGEP
jgi:hypothetical protein